MVEPKADSLTQLKQSKETEDFWEAFYAIRLGFKPMLLKCTSRFLQQNQTLVLKYDTRKLYYGCIGHINKGCHQNDSNTY